ncbi:MAG: hypothetical protein FJZ01_15120, partial [Candidatus Sericytochromatia bacterium]|nr:hypothetical protein [Candidatus Tanganyikabacteria bacterium]
MRIGWGWWVAAGLALLALWGLALRGSVLYAVERGETALGRKLERLSHDLRELRPTGARREEAGTTALSPLVRDRLAEFEMDTGATWSLLPLRQAQRWLAANEIAVDGRPARGGWVAATRPRAGTWEHMLMAGPPRHPGPPGEGPPAFAGPAPPPGMPPPPPGMLPPPGFGHGEAPTGSGRGPGRPA